MKKAFCVQAQALHKYSISNTTDITRFSFYYRLLRVTARILAIDEGEKRSLRNIAMPVETQSQQINFEFGAEQGLHWKFTAADAPWKNGCSESLVKSVKKAIKGVIGEQVLMFSELQTEPGDDLSPNHLMLRRSSARVCSKTDRYVLETLEQRLFSKSTDKAEVARREKKCQGRQCSSDPRFKHSSRTTEDGSCDTGVSRR